MFDLLAREHLLFICYGSKSDCIRFQPSGCVLLYGGTPEDTMSVCRAIEVQMALTFITLEPGIRSAQVSNPTNIRAELGPAL